jgi:putative membrane protein
MISEADRHRIAEEIRDAEARTAGEIVVVVAGQASGYRSIPILLALLAALATPWPLIWLTTLGPSRIFLFQLAVALVLTVVLSLPKRRYALVPGFIKRARAHESALLEFQARGLTRTRERTGILIYVAAAEHYAEIVPDTGIADRVDAAIWRETVADLIDAIRAGRTADGLIAAVRRAGLILAENAPPYPDDLDELPNKVVII